MDHHSYLLHQEIRVNMNWKIRSDRKCFACTYKCNEEIKVWQKRIKVKSTLPIELSCRLSRLWVIHFLCFTVIHQSFTAFETSTALCWDLSHQPQVSYLRLPQTSVSSSSLFTADSQIINSGPFWRIRANSLSIFSMHCMHLFQFHSISTALKWDQKTQSLEGISALKVFTGLSASRLPCSKWSF